MQGASADGGWASPRLPATMGGGGAGSGELAALVAAVAERQDPAAFARLFGHFAPRLHVHLTRLGADPAHAEEITQDVMATLWRKATLFDPARSSVGTWLYRIARNRRIDVLRRDRFAPLDEDGAWPDAASDADLDRTLDLRDREDAVRRALGVLPAEQLALVRLAFFEELSHSEIAERTGLPLGTVKSRIRLAFARLRPALAAHGAAEPG